MKVCTNCSRQMDDMDVFCPDCGKKQGEGWNNNPNSNTLRSGEVDAPNTGFAVLSFFFPIVGLILYLVWNNEYPLKAKSCGKGALIGFVSGIVFGICYGIVMAMFLAEGGFY